MSTKHPASVLPGIEIDIDTAKSPDYVAPADGNAYYLIGDERDNTLTGSDQADTFYGGLGNNTFNGGKGNDWFITGDPGSGVQNIIDGGDGKHDTVDYSGATAGATVDLGNHYGVTPGHLDVLTNIEDVVATKFNDTIIGDSGDNHISGGFGADVIEAGAGADVIDGLGSGGAFSDPLQVGLDGPNTASYEHSPAAVNVSLVTGDGHGGDAEGDKLLHIDNLTGSGFGDFLTGNSGHNVLKGEGGDDVLFGSAGGDVYDGGAGNDTVDFYSSTSDIVLSLHTGRGTGGDAAGASFVDIENVDGGSGNDTIVGDDKGNVLRGYGGNDTLQGGLGNDTLTGGTGNDTFVYHGIKDSDASGSKYDVITDFEAGTKSAPVDKIDLHDIAVANGISQFTYEANPGTQPHYAGEVITTAGTDASTGQAATFVDVYTNNDQAADMIIELMGNVTLHQSNFVS